MKGLKLNKTQISVLASEIYSELSAKANEYKNTPEYINFEDSLKKDEKYIALSKLGKLVDTTMKAGFLDDCYEVRTLRGRTETYVNTKRKEAFPYPNIPSKDTIENKIILATIDAEDLQSLITTVKESLNK